MTANGYVRNTRVQDGRAGTLVHTLTAFRAVRTEAAVAAVGADCPAVVNPSGGSGNQVPNARERIGNKAGVAFVCLPRISREDAARSCAGDESRGKDLHLRLPNQQFTKLAGNAAGVYEITAVDSDQSAAYFLANARLYVVDCPSRYIPE